MAGTVDVAALDPELRAALARHVLTLADSKRMLGIRYSDWLLGAPSIEAGIAVSSMAQDEWGHARLLYAMLKELDIDPVAVEHEREAERYANVGVLDARLEDWADVVAVMTVVDTALSVALEGFGEGGFDAARSRTPKMLAEEEFHRDLAFAWTRRLVAGSPTARERMAEALSGVFPRTLAWVSPDDDIAATLAAGGIVPAVADLGARLRAAVGPLMGHAGIDVADVEPDRADWDPARGRGAGRPDDEAVTRARGDLNRALFVE